MAKPRVGLFVTCLVDFFRPTVGFAALKLLTDAGCEVVVPDTQTCCGQPAFNSGADDQALVIARNVLHAFVDLDYVVAPSGSCAGMIRCHYPDLFIHPKEREMARDLAAKTYELVSFLVDVLDYQGEIPDFSARVTYHDSCSGLRELGIKKQPRKLLERVKGLELCEMKEPETCCGFGGTFCAKYPKISEHMVGSRTEDIAASGAEVLLGGDMGCLLNMAGKASRERRRFVVRHVAEVLAGMTGDEPIGGEHE